MMIFDNDADDENNNNIFIMSGSLKTFSDKQNLNSSA